MDSETEIELCIPSSQTEPSKPSSSEHDTLDDLPIPQWGQQRDSLDDLLISQCRQRMSPQPEHQNTFPTNLGGNLRR